MNRPHSQRGRMPSWGELSQDLLSARATIIFLVLLTLIEIILSAFGGVEAIPELYQTFGISRTGISKGWIWQLLSYGLLHANGFHLAINAALLLTVGPRLERIGGLSLWFKIILSGIILGGLFHLMLGGGGDTPPVLVGASGAAVAGLLWITGVSPDSRMWPIPVSGSSLGYGILIGTVILVLIQPSLRLPGLSSIGEMVDKLGNGFVFQASHACHLGGAIAGWFGAHWALRPRVTLAKLQKDRRRREGDSLD